jgi:hypothetical protein
MDQDRKEILLELINFIDAGEGCEGKRAEKQGIP